ncbi:MAG: ArnT family glycosyltransferase [Bacteroidota bacterium]
MIALLVFTYIIRSNFFLIPFERDEGIYAYFGKLILEGKIPYKDFYEFKYPGLFYAYALMIKIFGYKLYNLHLGFTILNLLNIVIVFFISRKFFRPVISLCSAIIFCILSLNPNISGFTIQSEHLVIFFISIGLIFVPSIKNINQNKYFLLVGLFFSIAVMIKTTAVIISSIIFFYLALVLLKENKFNLKTIFNSLLHYVLGFLIPIISFFILIYHYGSINEMFFFTYKISTKYITTIGLNEAYQNFKYSLERTLENHHIIWYISLGGFIMAFNTKYNKYYNILQIVLFLFSFIMIFPGFYFYGHYYLLIIPAVSIMGGNFIDKIVKFLNNKKRKFTLATVIVIFFIFIILHFNKLKAYYFKPDYYKVLRSTYGINPFPEAMEIGNWLNKNLKKNENFALIGSEPELYLYTDRLSLSRHAYFTAVVIDVPEHKNWQREFTTAIEKNNPKFFVYFNNPLSLLVQPNTDKHVFIWAKKYISSNYNLVGLVDMVSPNKTNYVWKENLQSYVARSSNLIYIYERKKSN